MKKQVQIFFTKKDEAILSVALRDAFPEIVFLDDNVWAEPKPVERSSIEACLSNYVYLWNKALFKELMIIPHPSGKFQGPGSGLVIQFGRSLLKDSILLSGRVAVGYDESHDAPSVKMDGFSKEVWRILKKNTTRNLAAVNPQTRKIVNPKVRGYLVGGNAALWCREKEGRFFKDRSVQNFYQ